MIASCVDSLNLQNDRNGSKSEVGDTTLARTPFPYGILTRQR
jgi:hypothetical protein